MKIVTNFIKINSNGVVLKQNKKKSKQFASYP